MYVAENIHSPNARTKYDVVPSTRGVTLYKRRSEGEWSRTLFGEWSRGRRLYVVTPYPVHWHDIQREAPANKETGEGTKRPPRPPPPYVGTLRPSSRQRNEFPRQPPLRRRHYGAEGDRSRCDTALRASTKSATDRGRAAKRCTHQCTPRASSTYCTYRRMAPQVSRVALPSLWYTGADSRT